MDDFFERVLREEGAFVGVLQFGLPFGREVAESVVEK